MALFLVSGVDLTRTFDSSPSFAAAGIASRAWDFGDGRTSTTTIPTLTYAAAGTYAVTLTVTDTVGQSTSFVTDVTVTSPAATTVYVIAPIPGAYASDVQIANMALAHIGSGKLITNLITDRSKEAIACNLFYAQTRDEVLQDFPWGFASRRAVLGLVGDDPTTEWSYSYRYPSDALAVRSIASGVSRMETPASQVPHRILSDETGRLLYTSQTDAVIEYTARVIDSAQYPPDFVQAVALKLAAYIAPSLMSDGAPGARSALLQHYALQLSVARRSSANEGRPDVAAESEFITGRN